MATEETTDDPLTEQAGQSLRRVRGRLFEAALFGATMFGIFALLVLIGYMVFDAFQPRSASAEWYLLYFVTLVVPMAAFVQRARERPLVKRTNTKVTAALVGGLLGSLLLYVVAGAVSPYDVLLYAVFTVLPPVAVAAYGRRSGNRVNTGPAIPVSIILGAAAATLAYPFIRPIIGIAAAWIAYYGFVTVPVAAGLAVVLARRHSTSVGLTVAGAMLAATAALAGALTTIGRNPSAWIVLFSGFLVPLGYVTVNMIRRNPGDPLTVAGPFIAIGGTLVGAVLERQLAIDGLDPFLTPTLITTAWHNYNASEAGVYPQLVGSILIVGVMAVLAFPVGIGAAIYLEEYAPESGVGGRLASLLKVNIANLAGVPSVVYGLLGLALFRRTLGFGTGIVISAAGTLGLLILPIVIVSTQEALRSVPDSLRQASYGMGASRWQTLRHVVLPEAIPGTLTGTILALARAIGETAPLVIIAVAATTYSAPEGLFSSAAALPLQVFAARSNVQEAFRHGVLPAAAIVLLVLMLLMNATAVIIRNRYDTEY